MKTITDITVVDTYQRGGAQGPYVACMRMLRNKFGRDKVAGGYGYGYAPNVGIFVAAAAVDVADALASLTTTVLVKRATGSQLISGRLALTPKSKLDAAPRHIRDYYKDREGDVIGVREILTDKGEFVSVCLKDGSRDKWHFEPGGGSAGGWKRASVPKK